MPKDLSVLKFGSSLSSPRAASLSTPRRDTTPSSSAAALARLGINMNLKMSSSSSSSSSGSNSSSSISSSSRSASPFSNPSFTRSSDLATNPTLMRLGGGSAFPPPSSSSSSSSSPCLNASSQACDVSSSSCTSSSAAAALAFNRQFNELEIFSQSLSQPTSSSYAASQGSPTSVFSAYLEQEQQQEQQCLSLSSSSFSSPSSSAKHAAPPLPSLLPANTTLRLLRRAHSSSPLPPAPPRSPSPTFSPSLFLSPNDLKADSTPCSSSPPPTPLPLQFLPLPSNPNQPCSATALRVLLKRQRTLDDPLSTSTANNSSSRDNNNYNKNNNSSSSSSSSAIVSGNVSDSSFSASCSVTPSLPFSIPRHSSTSSFKPKCTWAIPPSLPSSSSSSSYPSSLLLKHLTHDVEKGLQAGNALIMADISCSGAYFCRNACGRLIGVFKPIDEEPYAVNNPREEYRYRGREGWSDAGSTPIEESSGHYRRASAAGGTKGGKGGGRMKVGVAPGEAAVREATAFVLDDGFAGVPATILVSLCAPRLQQQQPQGHSSSHHDLSLPSPPPLRKTTSVGPGLPLSLPPSFPHPPLYPHSSNNSNRSSSRAKVGSLQQYVRHVGCAEDYGPRRFNLEDAQRVALLDLRLLNSDRNGGNILVAPLEMMFLGGEGGKEGGNDGRGRELLPLFGSTVAGATALTMTGERKQHQQQQQQQQQQWWWKENRNYDEGSLEDSFHLDPKQQQRSSNASPLPLSLSSPFSSSDGGNRGKRATSLSTPASPAGLRRIHSTGPFEVMGGRKGMVDGGLDHCPSPFKARRPALLLSSSSSSSSLSSLPPSSSPSSSPRRAHSRHRLLRRATRNAATAASSSSSNNNSSSSSNLCVSPSPLVGEYQPHDQAGREKWQGGEGGKENSLRLLPIDHGFCLPHPLMLEDIELCWHHWPQAKAFLPPSLRRYLLSLNVEEDIRRVKMCLGDRRKDKGEGLPPASFLTLRIGTALVQQGLLLGWQEGEEEEEELDGDEGEGQGMEGGKESRLTLHDLAGVVMREEGPERPSRLERVIETTYHALVAEVSSLPSPRPSPPTLKWGGLVEDETYHGRFMDLFKPRLQVLLERVIEEKREGGKEG